MNPLPLLLLLPFLTVTSTFGQDVLRLEPGQEPGRASLSEIAWLTGYWVGTGLGAQSDELWMPAVDNSMPGVYRFMSDGSLVFSEYMMVIADAGTLSIKLKHFNRDLSPWEEKDQWMEFKLVKLDGQTAYFNGLTYHRYGDSLLIRLAMRGPDGPKIEEFRLTKRDL